MGAGASENLMIPPDDPSRIPHSLARIQKKMQTKQVDADSTDNSNSCLQPTLSEKKILLPEHPDADAVSFRILWDAPARFKLSPGSYQDSDDFDPGLIYANCLLSSPPRIL